MRKDAYITADRQFRYDLVRAWDVPAQLWVNMLHVVMLNPSTADAESDDPTIKRLIHRGRDEGYNGIVVNNLFAFRSSYPSVLLNRWEKSYEVVGGENNQRIEAAAMLCKASLVAWGSHVMVPKREQKVLDILYKAGHPVLCVGLTMDGYPKHPLHVRYADKMFPYRGRFCQGQTPVTEVGAH